MKINKISACILTKFTYPIPEVIREYYIDLLVEAFTLALLSRTVRIAKRDRRGPQNIGIELIEIAFLKSIEIKFSNIIL